MLAFYLRQGAKAQHLKAFATLAKRGVIAPSAGAPPVHAPFMWLWAAFCCLSEKRQRSGEAAFPQPIELTQIESYANYSGFTGEDERTVLLHVVSALDTQFLKDYWEKRAEQTKNAKASQPR